MANLPSGHIHDFHAVEQSAVVFQLKETSRSPQRALAPESFLHAGSVTIAFLFSSERRVIIAPDFLHQFRIVYERVPVPLDFIDRIVPGDFLFADRIQLMSFQQHVLGPIREYLLVVARQHVRFPGSDLVLVAGGHIEIGTGKISLVFVHRLEDRLAITRVVASA